MEDNHPIEKLMVTAMNSIKQMVDVNTIIGEPIKALNNTVIIPISKVGFGFAAGGSEFNGETVNSYNKKEKEENIKYRLPFGGGSGAGVSISPVAFLIVQNENVRLLEATHSSVLDKLIEYVPDAVEKVSQIIKTKMNKEDEYLDDEDFEEEDEFDDFDDEIDDDEDWFDENNNEDYSTTEDFIEEFKVEEKEDKKSNKKNSNKNSEDNKKDVNQTMDTGHVKAKKLEEKIEEIKKNKKGL